MTHIDVDPVKDGRLIQPVTPQSSWSRTMSASVMKLPFMIPSRSRRT